MKEPVNISIDGTPILSFNHLFIRQEMYRHHDFELSLDATAMEAIGNHTMEAAHSWVGKGFVAMCKDFQFEGIVSAVDLVQRHGFNSDLMVRGHSPTILLEAGAHLNSWNEKPLQGIVEDSIIAPLNKAVKPAYSGTIDYMCQYRETHYDFLLRLARQYNEWMFYDGLKFYFGKPDGLPSTTLTYGKDMDDMQLSVRMRPLKSFGLSYQSKKDEQLSAPADDGLGELNELGRHAVGISKENFAFEPVQTTSARVSNKKELDDYMKRKMKAAAGGLTWLTGTSTNTALMPGTVAEVKATIRKTLSFEDKAIGKYMIFKVSHYFGSVGEYHNDFEALPSSLERLPEPEVQYPSAEIQLGKVLDNNDPDSQGKVQVQLQWQELAGLKTPFVRVMTPDAGSSDKVSKNRGLVLIPEVGDQVIVAFRYNDPTRPFVLGSLFHGKVGSGGGGSNNTKSLSSKSGHTVTLDDGGGIDIKDKTGGNFVNIDGNNKVTVTSSQTIELTNGKASITLDGDKITIYADIIEIAKNGGESSSIEIKGLETTMLGKTTLSLNSDATAELVSKGTIGIEAKATLNAKGALTTVEAQGITTVKGATVNIN
jgi:type VI secretion system secreted protein VgrG